jgi:hypothetical protein
VTGPGCMGATEHFQHTDHSMSWTVQVTWGQALSCNMITPPHKHDGTISLYDNTKVLEGFTIALCTDGDVSVLEHQC